MHVQKMWRTVWVLVNEKFTVAQKNGYPCQKWISNGYPMDIHFTPWCTCSGYPPISMDIHFYPWISMDCPFLEIVDIHGYYMDIPNGYSWILVDISKLQWTLHAWFLVARISMDIHFVWISISHINKWISMDNIVFPSGSSGCDQWFHMSALVASNRLYTYLDPLHPIVRSI